MKRFFLTLILVLIVAPVIFIGAALETRPVVPLDTAVSPEDAQRARALFREFRALTEVTDGDRDFRASESDLQSAMRFATRAVPSARGIADVSSGNVNLAASVGLPADLWLNISADIGESKEGLLITWFRFGRFNLPPQIIVPLHGVLPALAPDDTS